MTVASTNRGNWIVGVVLCKDNPYDGHTLAAAIAKIEEMTEVRVTDAYVDKGDYRGKRPCIGPGVAPENFRVRRKNVVSDAAQLNLKSVI